MKKISIVTINLNNKDGLERTIRSVTSQTMFDKIDYIVIDGNSDDGSKDVLDEYKEYFSYYCSENDEGIYNAMNKGILHCDSEYVLFLNSGDEFFENDVIEKCYDELDSDIVYGDMFIVFKEDKGAVKRIRDVVDIDYFINESLPHSSSFIRTELLRKNKYDEDYKIISDWIFFFNEIIVNRCPYKHIDVVVSRFYLGGITSDNDAMKAEKRAYFETFGNRPRLTIIMPCYNYSRYITEALESVKKSTYKHWHCIIVNDGSTDDSEEVILKYIEGDRRFTYIRQTNRGLSASRNIGIRAANSKYVLCLDPDDKISDTYLEKGVEYLDNHDDCTLYYGNAKLFYDDGSERDWKLDDFSYRKLLEYNHIYSAYIYRKEDFLRLGGYDEVMKGYEDWEFLIRLLFGGRTVYRTDDVVFYYRKHEGSMDSNARKDVEKFKNYILSKNKELMLLTLNGSKNGNGQKFE